MILQYISTSTSGEAWGITLGIFMFYVLAKMAVSHNRRAREERALGCQPVRHGGIGLLLRQLRNRFKSNGPSVELHLPQVLHGIFESHGDTWTIPNPRRRVVFTRDPRILQAVLSTHFHSFGVAPYRLEAWSPLLGSGIVSVDGDQWHIARNLLRPHLSKKHFWVTQDIEVHVQRLLDRIFSGGTLAVKLDLMPLLYSFTTDWATQFFFGSCANSLLEITENSRPQTSEELTFAEAFTIAQEGISIRGDVGSFMARFLIQDIRLFWKACEKCRLTISEYTDNCRNATENVKNLPSREKNCVFDEILAENVSSELGIDLGINLMLAGRDSTAVTLGWAIDVLSRHPKVLCKLRREIFKSCPDTRRIPQLSVDSVQKLPYLKAFVMEVLRLYPPLPINGRVALKDTVLPYGGGYDGKSPILVKRGDGVFFSTFSMHRRKDVYGTDADIFVPERWDEDGRLKWRNDEFDTSRFLAGPRICLGQDTALAVVSYTLARIIQDCEFVTPVLPLNKPEDNNRDTYFANELNIVMSPANGIMVELRRSSLEN